MTSQSAALPNADPSAGPSPGPLSAPAVRKPRPGAQRAMQSRFRLPDLEPTATSDRKPATEAAAKPPTDPDKPVVVPGPETIAQLLPPVPAQSAPPTATRTAPKLPGLDAGVPTEGLSLAAPQSAPPLPQSSGKARDAEPSKPLADALRPEPQSAPAQPKPAPREPKAEQTLEPRDPAIQTALARLTSAPAQPSPQPPALSAPQVRSPSAEPQAALAAAPAATTATGPDSGGPGGQGGAPSGRAAGRDRQMLPFRLDVPQAFGPAASTADVAPQEVSPSPASTSAQAPAPADVRIAQSRADALDVTISAASPALRDRIAAAEGELRSDLGRIGAEVDRIHVELRGDGTALSALAEGGSAGGADTGRSFLGSGQDGGSQPDPGRQVGDFRPDPSGPDADWLDGMSAGAGNSRPQEGQSDGRHPAERPETGRASQTPSQAAATLSVRHPATTPSGRIDRYA